MFRSKLTRFLKLVLFSGILLSNIEIASAQLNGSGQAQLVEGRSIIVRQGKEMGVAVGAAGTILTSSDGSSWTSRTSGTTYGLWDVTYKE